MSRSIPVKFRLYTAGDAQNSLSAIANLTAFCRIYLADRHHIEIIDVLREPGRALRDGILLTPTLLKLSPAPVCRIVGALSQKETLSQALGMGTLAA